MRALAERVKRPPVALTETVAVVASTAVLRADYDPSIPTSRTTQRGRRRFLCAGAVRRLCPGDHLRHCADLPAEDAGVCRVLRLPGRQAAGRRHGGTHERGLGDVPQRRHLRAAGLPGGHRVRRLLQGVRDEATAGLAGGYRGGTDDARADGAGFRESGLGGSPGADRGDGHRFRGGRTDQYRGVRPERPDLHPGGADAVCDGRRGEGPGRTLAMAISGVLVRERLVWMAYYLNFEDAKTIERLRMQSDAFVMGMLEAS